MPPSVRLAPAFLLAALLPVTALAESWGTKIVHPVYPPDTTVTAAAVAPYLAMSVDSLRACITTEGATDTNTAMKTAAANLAALYQRTGNPACADRAVIVLERFAEVIPSWPLMSREGKTTPLDRVDYSDWSLNGLWRRWYHYDLERAREFPLAYDWVSSSGAFERRSAETGRDTRAFVEDNLLRYSVELNLRKSYFLMDMPARPDGRGPFPFGNMSGVTLNGLIVFGRVFEPEYVHYAVDKARVFLTAKYFRDGVWEEGSQSYHVQITNDLFLRVIPALKGYSDPPGYVNPETGLRLDNVDIEREFPRQISRIRTALNNFTLPNGHYFNIHDAHSRDISPANPDSVTSYCWFGSGTAVMARGTGMDAARTFLHFGGTYGHEHADCLNLGLWALGGELMSEGEYVGNRPWSSSSAGHNLVVVDGASQRRRGENTVAPGPDDMVDGVPYQLSLHGHGDSRNFGSLLLWDTAAPGIQVVEAGGENTYAGVSRYRRTVMMVDTGAGGFYLLDLFRVKGGETHDWMLHGFLGQDYTETTSLAAADTAGTRFTFVKLAAHATTGETWWNEFSYASGTRLRTTFLPAPGTGVSTGLAPAMRRAGDAPFLDVRRTGGDNCFAAVHDPYRGTPKVIRASLLTPAGGADGFVAVKIELADGRVDYIAHTLDAAPYPERRIPGTKIRFRGRLVHVVTRDGATESAYLLEGASLVAKKVSLAAKSGDFSWRGRVTGITRIENGGAEDAFITPAALPTDGSLAGKTLLLTLADGRTEGYTIARVERRGTGSAILVNEEPGMELRDGGALAKLVYFPWHGVRGPVDFLVSGSAFRAPDGKTLATAPLKK